MKDYINIEDLLEKYWNCETSQAEEREIKKFFSGGNIPQHLEKYRELFILQQEEVLSRLGEEFDSRIIGMISGEENSLPEESIIKGKKRKMLFMKPLIGIAAALVITAGAWVVYDNIPSGTNDMLIADTYSSPEEALEGLEQIFGFVNAKLDKGYKAVEKGVEKSEPLRQVLSPIINTNKK